MKNYKILIPIFFLILIQACSSITKDTTTGFSPPEWSYNKSIYEVNIRQYTPEGTFNSFKKHLPKLKEMGVGIIWLMPIHPIGEKNRKGTLGSYYSVKDYKGINQHFGNEEDFRNLVNEIHDLGMYVIIDWVANHTSWDHPWTISNKHFYSLDSDGNFTPPVADWSDVIDLNYDNKELWPHMIDALKYWVEEFDIDGYRCDVAAMVPNEFWSLTRSELDKIKPVFMLAEAHEPELHENGFDMTYGWQLKDLMNDFANGEKTIQDFRKYFTEDEKEYPYNAFRMNFTTNHDENSWNGTVYERLGELALPLSVLFSTASGMPLVYSGQEAGLDKALKFFEKDTILWKDHVQKSIFSKIFNEKKTNEALWNGIKGGEMKFFNASLNDQILAYYREMGDNKVIVIINLSDEESEIKIPNNLFEGKYQNLFNGKFQSIEKYDRTILEAYGYLVLVN
jgi:glycosidase